MDNNKVKICIKKYLMELKNTHLPKNYTKLINDCNVLENKIEDYVINHPNKFIEILNKKNSLKEIITLKYGSILDEDTIEQQDDEYVSLLKKYSELNIDKIKTNFDYINQLINNIIKNIDSIKTQYSPGDKFVIINHTNLSNKINNFLDSDIYTEEKKDIAYLYYSNNKLVNTFTFKYNYNKIMEKYNNSIDDLPKKLFTNSLTKNITDNIILFEESYILELLYIFNEISKNNIVVNNVNELKLLCNYLPNIKFYDFLNSSVVLFYDNIINKMSNKSLQDTFVFLKEQLTNNKKINIDYDCNNKLKYYLLQFNLVKKELDDYYYKYMNTDNNLISFAINCERNSNYTINISNIHGLFNECDNLFNYINLFAGNDMIKISISDNKFNYSIECGIDIIKLENKFYSSVSKYISCSNKLLKNFYQTINEIKKRQEKYNPSGKIIIKFEFVTFNKKINNVIIIETSIL